LKLYVSIFLLYILTIQSDWIRFRNDLSGFSVLVPGEMIHSEKEIFTDLGNIIFRTFQYTPNDDNDNATYIIHHYAYPDSILSTDSTGLINEILEATVDQSVINLGGSLDYQRPINYKSNSGILYRIKYNKGKAVLKSKAYVIGDDFYVLQVFAKVELSLNNLMDYFLDSFLYLDAKSN
jgi:hypothetical protein